MERRSFVRGAGLAGVLAAGTAPAIVHAQANIRWRLASSFPKALDTIYGAAEPSPSKVKDMTGGKFEISVHAGGELMPAFGVVDAVQNGTVEWRTPRPTTSSARTRPSPGLRHPLRPEQPPDDGLDVRRQRPEADARVLRQYNIVNFPMGNTGAQMGGWYRKEIKSRGRHQGPEDAHRRLRRQGAVERMGGVPQNIPAAKSTRRWKRAPSTPPSGSVRTTTRSWASTRWPALLLPGWWEGGPQLDLYVNQGLRRACRPSTRPSSSPRLPMPHRHAGQVRRPQPGRAQAPGGRWCQAVAVPEGRDGRGLQGVHGAVQRM
jgi:hypothetical protein